MRKDHHVFLGVFLCALLLFTVYVLLDTFVIVRRLETAAEPKAVSAQADGETGTPVALPFAASPEEKAEAVITENSYHDGNISIEITEERLGDTTVYLADVRLASADWLKTAFADNTYGRNVTDTTSGIAEAADAILAINGDFYGARQSGFVIRGGVLYRSTAKKGAEDLVIYADGSFGIIREAEITAQELLESG
ncbi:MAG: phosphodiester glycosidase family protein, partial [Clostridia bacterium]|nr:phosphodiester glycosidase family protein [Clostridia bacterium]